MHLPAQVLHAENEPPGRRVKARAFRKLPERFGRAGQPQRQHLAGRRFIQAAPNAAGGGQYLGAPLRRKNPPIWLMRLHLQPTLNFLV
jgi:hypothetical protein